MKHRSLATFIACAGSLFLLACGPDGAPGEGEGETEETIEDELVARALAFQEEGFTRLSTRFASQHATAEVEVWASEGSTDAYLALDPAQDAPSAFDEGAMLIKRHLDDEGAADGVTVMAKRAAGYDADHADWWWARLESDGTRTTTGKVGFCIDCHSPREPAGYVFGLASDQRP